MAGSTSVTPTLAQLRELIKKEARIKGSDNLDDFIDGLVNELLCDYAQKNFYFELFVKDEPITTTLNNGTYDLPDNFVRMRLVRYMRASTYTYTIKPRTNFIDTARGSVPRYYDIVGAEIQIFPIDDIPAGDTLLLDYYIFPSTLVSGDTFPIPRLVAPVKLEAIRRVLIFNTQLQAAQVHRGDSIENEVRSRKP